MKKPADDDDRIENPILSAVAILVAVAALAQMVALLFWLLIIFLAGW